eukprot:g3656.t1
MCGVIGVALADHSEDCNQFVYDGLTVLQHRGQDAAGIATCDVKTCKLHLRKANGLVKDVFQQWHMTELTGSSGIGHCRYPTAGTSSSAEAQPFYTNSPYGICLAHNGNLINSPELRQELSASGRHCNTSSDSEGGYACVAMINGIGIVGFRDQYGIRPLCYGSRSRGMGDSDGVLAEAQGVNHNEGGHLTNGSTSNGMTPVEGLTPSKTSISTHSGVNPYLSDFVIASESVAIDALEFSLQRDIAPGECIFIDLRNRVHMKQCAPRPILSPCIFEHVYMARPDSIIDGISVYHARLLMGIKLAKKIKRSMPNDQIDVVIPIPDTSRVAALQCAYVLGVPYREGFIKNRYIARTFIMPGQKLRKKSVRRKLNPIRGEFQGRNVLLVDDSIVRGTTSTQLVQMARESGAVKVYMCSAAPAIRHPNVYGIDMPSRNELVAAFRNDEGVAKVLGADKVIYQDLVQAVQEANPLVPQFDTSCFSGEYVTNDVTESYFEGLEKLRNDKSKSQRDAKFTANLMTGISSKNEEEREEEQRRKRRNDAKRAMVSRGAGSY